METVGNIADIVGILSAILGAIFAFFAWIQARRVRQQLEQEEERKSKTVRVVLRSDTDTVELPVELRRRELTRAELMGRIGMIPIKAELQAKKQPRFRLDNTNKAEFFRQINQAVNGDGDVVLTIDCSQEELEQFDV